MGKFEDISTIVVQKYKEDKPDSSYINCVVDFSSEWNYFFFKSGNGDSPYKKGKFYIKDIIPINSSLPSFSTGIKLNGRKLTYNERTGLFKILFSDDSFMYVAKWFSGIGKNRAVESMFGTEGDTWVKFLKMSKYISKRKVKPKIGVFTLEYQPRVGLFYKKFSNVPNVTIYHDELDIIKDSVNYYFNHVSDFMKYNQSGRRSLLLYGEPGTSKTSTLYKLALEHKNNKSIVFCTDINAMALHIELCEKYSIPTVACLEDCESALRFNDSNLKSFMSGIKAGRNKSGTCIIYTTNHPEIIENSIIERPERIDELHYIGTISNDMLINCAKFYFGEFSPSEEDLRKVLTKPMTGAEIKLFAENTMKYCASSQKDIDIDSMKAVLHNYRDDVKQLQRFSKGKSEKTFTQRSNSDDVIGFKKEFE